MAPTLVQVFLGLALALSVTSAVRAESHTVKFDNQCGKGTPTLIVGGKVVSTGEAYTSNGALVGGIGYLQTGECGFNGEGCTLMEMTLGNPTCAGCGSSSDISLIAPHAFNVETTFSYFGGCDGQGATCNSESCNTAFHQPNDNQVQVQCQDDNVNLLITFCGSSGTQSASSSAIVTSKAATTSKAAATTTSSHAAASSSSIAAPVTTAASSSSVASTTASAPSASASVNRKTCKAKREAKRAAESLSELAERSHREARDLYNLHDRRQRVRARAHRRSH